ncbi:hypothetical protein BU17DRAFT_82698 [Hysterangium stoloniferum]|nr:hypothetical protein BU17DRAFT_82698 [Hysterangium stoloniferum]
MTPLLRVFFRDGAMYCLIVWVMYLVNILTIKYGGISPLQMANFYCIRFGWPFGAEPSGKRDLIGH